MEPFPNTGMWNLEPFPSIGLENIYNLYPVLDRGTYRTFLQYWTLEPFPSTAWTGEARTFPSNGLGITFSSIGLENISNLYPVMDRGTCRTFSQYWTWDLIELFPSTAWNGEFRIISQ